MDTVNSEMIRLIDKLKEANERIRDLAIERSQIRLDFNACYQELQGERKRADKLETAIKYATDYLDQPLNQIGYGSKAHRELLEAIKE